MLAGGIHNGKLGVFQHISHLQRTSESQGHREMGYTVHGFKLPLLFLIYMVSNVAQLSWGIHNVKMGVFQHISNFKHFSQYRQYTASTRIYGLRCCAIILFAVLKFSFCLSFPKFCPRQTADMSSCSSAPGPTTTMDGGYRDYLSRSISVIK